MTELLERPDGAPTPEDDPVCRHCGSDDLASVEVAGYWQSVSIVPDDDADGDPDDPWTTGDDWASYDSGDGATVGVACRNCDTVASDEHRAEAIVAAAAAYVEKRTAAGDEPPGAELLAAWDALADAVKAPTWRYSDLLMARRDWDALPDRRWTGSIVYYDADSPPWSAPIPTGAVVEAPTEYLAHRALVAWAQERWRELGIPASSYSPDHPAPIYAREAVPVDEPAA